MKRALQYFRVPAEWPYLRKLAIAAAILGLELVVLVVMVFRLVDALSFNSSDVIYSAPSPYSPEAIRERSGQAFYLALIAMLSIVATIVWVIRVYNQMRCEQRYWLNRPDREPMH